MFAELEDEDPDEEIGLTASATKKAKAEKDDSMNSSSLSKPSEEIKCLEPYDFDKLPPYHCVYCGIHDPKAIV